MVSLLEEVCIYREGFSLTGLYFSKKKNPEVLYDKNILCAEYYKNTLNFFFVVLFIECQFQDLFSLNSDELWIIYFIVQGESFCCWIWCSRQNKERFCCISLINSKKIILAEITRFWEMQRKGDASMFSHGLLRSLLKMESLLGRLRNTFIWIMEINYIKLIVS